MVEIPIDAVQHWVEAYGNTKRSIFLHPEMVEHESKFGGSFRPINDSLYNVDNQYVDSIKRLYIGSKTFNNMSTEEKLAKLEELGLSPALSAELMAMPKYRKLFEAML